MHQITTAELKAAVKLDPAWASKLTNPVEITDYCDMEGSKITHLSPLLHFTGKNKYGWSANFFACKSLKIAEGKFDGFVIFSTSGIEKIRGLICGKDNDGYSAEFTNCESLKLVEGNFEGWVGFSGSGIEKIGELTCGKNIDGIRLNVEDCSQLKEIPLQFSPGEITADPEPLEKLKKRRLRKAAEKHLQTAIVKI